MKIKGRTFLGVFGEDVANVVFAIFTKDLNEALSSIQAFRREAINIIAVGVLGRFLAVANHINDWGCLARY
jgi:hypothetical protein